jgi:hypothetical protein
MAVFKERQCLYQRHVYSPLNRNGYRHFFFTLYTHMSEPISKLDDKERSLTPYISMPSQPLRPELSVAIYFLDTGTLNAATF